MNSHKKTVILYSLFGVIIILLSILFSIYLNPGSKIQTKKNAQNDEIKTVVKGSMSMSFISSDTGMSTIISTYNDKYMVIDTGSGSNTFLEDFMNGERIDTLIITNWSPSHVGGLNRLLSVCKVDSIYLPSVSDINAIHLMDETEVVYPAENLDINIDDTKVVFEQVANNNLALMLVHGADRILFQGEQTINDANELMKMNKDLMTNNVSGLVLAGNGNNEYFNETFMDALSPKFVVANITLIDQTCNKIDEYVRNNDIDFYNFSYNDTVPLHFSSSGSGVEFIGFE